MSKSPKQKKQPLSFNEFKLETIVAELRFPFSFILWDIAGELWHELEEQLPTKSFLITNASPSSVTVTYDNKYEIGIEQERFVLNTSSPKATFPEFLEILKIIFELVSDKLKIELFTRIGFRQVFVKQYPSIKKVAEDLLSLPSIIIPSQILSDNTGSYIAPGITIRVEDGNKGKFFNLRGQNRTFEVNIPSIIAPKPDEVSNTYNQSILAFDIDFYTQIQVPIGQLSILDWFKQAHDSVVKDAGKFF